MNIPLNKCKIAVVGGDARMLHCAKNIAEKDIETAIFGYDMIEEEIGKCTRCKSIDDALFTSNIVILPMPVTTDGINLYSPLCEQALSLPTLFSMIGKDTVVLGGNVAQSVNNLAEKFGLNIIDYFDREELKIANAYLTAESAIEVAMTETEQSLRDYPVLVIGYGRIGKTLCMLLKAMGCKVFASARKNSDKAWIHTFGYMPVDTGKISDCLSECKLIFNTVPFMVLDKENLLKISKDSLIIDLASNPGGVAFEAAKEKKIRVIWALALPGKKLKKSAGRAISETVLNILEEEEKLL